MFRAWFSLLPKAHWLAAAWVMAALMSPAMAQQKTGGKTELVFLGTAAGPPLRLDRSEPATLLVVDGRPYLIDCGIGTIRRLVEMGIPSETIRTIFLTHLHADHDLGLADVMANDFFQLNMAGSTANIAIYGPPQTQGLVDAAFQYLTFGFRSFAAEPGAIRTGMKDGVLRSPFVAHDLQNEGLVYQDDKIRVMAAENSHYALMSSEDRQTMKSYSYRIETPHGVVVFTGDTGPSEAVTRLASGADVLVSEVEDLSDISTFVERVAAQNHWPPARKAGFLAHMRQEHLGQTELGEMATKAHVKAVVLYHYDPDDPASYVSGVKKSFGGPVFASADRDRYCLGGVDSSPNTQMPLTRCTGAATSQGESSVR